MSESRQATAPVAPAPPSLADESASSDDLSSVLESVHQSIRRGSVLRPVATSNLSSSHSLTLAQQQYQQELAQENETLTQNSKLVSQLRMHDEAESDVPPPPEEEDEDVIPPPPSSSSSAYASLPAPLLAEVSRPRTRLHLHPVANVRGDIGPNPALLTLRSIESLGEDKLRDRLRPLPPGSSPMGAEGLHDALREHYAKSEAILARRMRRNSELIGRIRTDLDIPPPPPTPPPSPHRSSLDHHLSRFAHRHRDGTDGGDAKLMIGLMSGTSLDGVDAVLADFDQSEWKSGTASNIALTHPSVQLCHHFVAMPSKLRSLLLLLNTPGGAAPLPGGELHQSHIAANMLARLYAKAVNELLEKAGVKKDAVRAVANHGQTVRHCPDLTVEDAKHAVNDDGDGDSCDSTLSGSYGYTTQLCNNALLVELTGLPVVGDFRSRDVAAFGGGAPLACGFHRAFFANDNSAGEAIILNLGGIANVTHLRPDGTMSGFDTGPANALSDLWIQQQHIPELTTHSSSSSSSTTSPSTLQFDENGAWASGGSIVSVLLDRALAEPYFTRPPPKSTGRDLFHTEWMKQIGCWAHVENAVKLAETTAADDEQTIQQAKHRAAQDVMATLVEVTARSVADAINKYCTVSSTPSHCPVYVCGGGALNSFLLSRLRFHLPGRSVSPTSVRGIDPQCVESLAFAWLGWKFLQAQTTNEPRVTGAKGKRILGCYYPL